MNQPQYENQPQPETAITFINTLNLEYSAVFVPQSQSRNASPYGIYNGENLSLNWRVTISNGRASITTDYMQGIGHLPDYKQGKKLVIEAKAEEYAAENGRFNYRQYVEGNRGIPKKLTPPTLTDVLYSLVSDSDVLNYSSFEDWAENFGYDTDSRKAEDIYKACLDIALKLRAIIDIDAAQTAFQDY